jgi:hypothetical protein
MVLVLIMGRPIIPIPTIMAVGAGVEATATVTGMEAGDGVAAGAEDGVVAGMEVGTAAVGTGSPTSCLI